ncbi:MAG: AMP-binding protein [Betaproteobacteria bacterium]|nr:AMP-binding protein [Betaproteobacteria bacterium]
MAAMPNGFDMVCLYFALAKLGAIVVFINPDYEESLFNALVCSLKPVAVVLDDDNMRKLAPASAASIPSRIGWPGDAATPGGNLSFGEMLAGDPEGIPRTDLRPGDPAQFIFTSGTTGLPKPCILSNRARIALVGQINRCLGAGSDDRFFACLPNSHGNVFLGILGAVMAGGSFALAERFSASRYWQQARASRATILVLHGVPLNILLQAAPASDAARHDARAVITIGGRYAEFLERFGVERALIGYGSTEAGGLISLSTVTREETARVPASFAGRIRDDIEVRIADPEDEALPAGEPGEILVRPIRPSVVSDGFSGMPDRTVETRQNLWLHTGDLGYVEAGGALHFMGGGRDASSVGGEFVPVEYLESLVRRDERVEECAIVGVPAAVGEEEIKLFIQIKATQRLTEEEVLGILRPKVPRYMLPRRVAFVAEFPRAPVTLKIQKSKLLSME